MMRVLFVCHGNINRSPTAELLLRHKYGFTEVKSVGFRESKKLMGKKMRTILIRNGLPEEVVLKHRSTTITKKLVNWADIIFCMDNGNLTNFTKSFPKGVKKVELLSSYLSIKKIPDPGFSKGTEMYEEVYDLVNKAIYNFVKKSTVDSIPIVIPSRGRAGHAPFLNLLKREGIDCTIVVEKQEKKDYKSHYPSANIEVLPKSNQGIAYSRNQILKKRKGKGWYWLIDDDITKFSKYDAGTGKFKDITFYDFLLAGNEVIRRYSQELPLAAVGYRQTVFGLTKKHGMTDKQVMVNSRVIQFVAINPDIILDNKISYQANPRTMEDEYLLIQLFKKKLSTIKINLYKYHCPYSATPNQIGGVTGDDTLKYGKLKVLKKKFPDVVQILSKDGGVHGNPQYSINWGKLSKSHKVELSDDGMALKDLYIDGSNKSKSRGVRSFFGGKDGG